MNFERAYAHCSVSRNELKNDANVEVSALSVCVVCRYVKYREVTNAPVADGTKVIAMSLYGKEPKYTHGAIRNAQIARMFFPGWTLRFYDNKSVEYFVIRQPDNRLSDRDFAAVSDWLSKANEHPFHCMRDHESHKDNPIVSGTWGAKSAELIKLLGKPRFVTLQTTVEKATAGLHAQQFASDTLWPAVKDKSLSHDSVSCDKWPHSIAFPRERTDDQFVGQLFDAYGTPLNSFTAAPVVNQSTCTGL